jgi:hypothetical protein
LDCRNRISEGDGGADCGAIWELGEKKSFARRFGASLRVC